MKNRLNQGKLLDIEWQCRKCWCDTFLYHSICCWMLMIMQNFRSKQVKCTKKLTENWRSILVQTILKPNISSLGRWFLDWKTSYLCFNLQAKKLASVLHRKTCWFVANIPPTWCTWAVEHCRSILSLFDWLWCPCFCPLLEACSGICWPHVDFVHKVAWQNCKSWMHHHSDWFERNYSTIAESPRTQSNWDTWSTSTKHRSTWKIEE